MFWFLKNSPAPYNAPASFTISRRLWARGGQNGSSRLLNERACRCCLGFYAQACGIADIFLLDVPGPVMLNREHGIETPKLIPMDSRPIEAGGELIARFIEANDTTITTEAAREERITELFAEIGVKVEFVE